MDLTLTPTKLCGTVKAPPSKSVAHRLIIAAALSLGESKISNLAMSQDISATIEAMKALGADIKVDGDTAFIRGIEKPSKTAVIDCGESGSTLRFLIPVAAALGTKTEFRGRGKLPTRPITPYLRELTKKGVTFDYDGTMPFEISGKLESGVYDLEGDISSQFVTGLMMALSLLPGERRINMLTPLQSKPYVDITVEALRQYGADIKESSNGYTVCGKKLSAHDGRVEGDYSQAAFFFVANALGSEIEITDLDPDSAQGDKRIKQIVDSVVYNSNEGQRSIKPFSLDCSDIPDLVPILTVLAAFAEGKSEITNVARLRIKESDRLFAIAECLNRLGGNVKAYDDRLEIAGVKSLNGGVVDSFNDHRIAMSMAIASTRSRGDITIKDAGCVKKSYPDFFEVYKKLGGK